MSEGRSYPIKKSFKDVIREKGRIIFRLRPLLPIVEENRMKEWFKQALKEDGAKQNKDNTLNFKIDSVDVKVDVDKKEAILTAESEELIKIEKQVFNYELESFDKQIKEEVKQAKKRNQSKAIKNINDIESKAKAFIRKAENKAIEKGLEEKGESIGELIKKENRIDVNGDKRIIWNIKAN
ncbi:MAG: hypothetical protein HQK78_17850 [Desulfobacterales bacterium]|nr:hypothetical protein [Desulfobacterales bacterium]